MVKPDDEAWPLEPLDAREAAGIGDVLATFAKGVAGGAITLFGLGAIVVPNLIETRGATRSWMLEKQQRQRCLELGLTPDQLDELERQRPPEPR